jgi:hypothetical protein
MGEGTSGGEHSVGLEAGQAQAPPVQTEPARVQVTSQVPHAPESDARSRHSGTSAGQEVAAGTQSQVPATQAPSAGAGEGRVQACPQDPQFCGFAWRSTQVLPHTTCWAGQLQSPAEHVAPTGQTFPHAPQAAVLVCRSRQTPPQSVWPLGQLGPSSPLHAARARARERAGAARVARRPGLGVAMARG